MPTHRVRFTSLARADLRIIRRHSLKNWGQRQATEYMDSILGAAESLGNFPERGSISNPDNPTVRRVITARHVIYYRVLETEIEILRILHERLDASGQFD
jgi:toxin ParE1/3/4